ncbi:MAG: permease [Epsilonproteobacteria bacterium]|nr:permease [Campylobacterota bacterium]
MTERFIKEFKKAFMGLVSLLPMIVAVMLLVGIFQVFVTKDMLASVFTSNPISDTIIGTLSGAVAVGQAIISYIIGGELLKEGISLYAVTAFMLAWVTLGIVQLPAESSVFGLRFTVYRNILAFIFTILVAIATVATLEFWNIA